MSRDGVSPTPADIEAHQALVAQLAAVPRWGLWDFAPNSGQAAKVFIPVQRSLWGGLHAGGLTSRADAEKALILQRGPSTVLGIGPMLKGIAVKLSPRDAAKYQAVSWGAEIFQDASLADLAIGQATNGAAGNGHAPTPTPALTPGTPEAQLGTPVVDGHKTRSRGVRLPIELWDALDAHSADRGVSVTELLIQIVREYFVDVNHA